MFNVNYFSNTGLTAQRHTVHAQAGVRDEETDGTGSEHPTGMFKKCNCICCCISFFYFQVKKKISQGCHLKHFRWCI